MEIETRKKKYLRLLSYFTITAGAIAILGWIFNAPALKSVYPGLPPMRFNPALVLISLGISFHFLAMGKRKYLLRILCFPIIVYGIACIYQDMAKVNLGIDVFFVKDAEALSMGYAPGRPPVAASISFILMAAAFLILSAGKEKTILITQYLLHFVSFISFFVILGYILNFPSYYKLYLFSSLALNMAISLFLLSIGAAFLHDKGIISLFIGNKTGNVQARRLFPLMLAFLILITFLRVLTYKNEWITEETGIAFIITLFTIATLLIIWYNTKELNRLEDKRRTASERLRKNEKEYVAKIEKINKDLSDYKLALDAANDITITDQHGNIREVNDNFCRLSKYFPEDLLGKNHNFLNSGYHPKEFFQNLWQTITAGKIWRGEIRNKAKDGTFFWVNTTIVPFVDQSDTPYKYVAIRSDITERIQAHKMLEEKIKELESANKELESFNYVSSHDLQEPIRKIQSFANMLLKEDMNLSKESKDSLQRIAQAADQSRALINDLLAYSRTHRAERLFEKTDLNEIFNQAVVNFNEVIQEKNAIVTNKALCTVNAIRFQLRQVFINLIANSFKFASPERQLHINVRSEIIQGSKINNPELSKEKNYCHTTYEDNGIGFEPRFNEKIFELFERLNHNKYHGTGIGLSICKKAIENHHGTITATGKPGAGARFDIYIPAE